MGTSESHPQIVSLERIWDGAPHCAFTDLVRFADRWLCTFRESDRHGGGQNGKVRVIESPDGESWGSAALLEEPGLDLRDPKLSEMPDGRLMLAAGACLDDGDTYLTRSPRIAFSADGRDWTPLHRVLAEDHWLWRVTWREGRAWSVSKLNEGRLPRRAMLYSSTDGLRWEWVTEFHDIPGFPSETTLRFAPDGEMIALMRRNETGWIGTSRPPYTQWQWADAGHKLGGPNFIILPNGDMWAGSRYNDGGAKTALIRMTRDSYEAVLILPSGGDTSYPGMVWHDGLLWMTYYSSHEQGTNIYLAKIRLGA